ncbi:ABC transporter ATP-binding protein [Bacillus pseudomycoides]|uniref:Sodium ABC transporter ATP-binding protein n=1 Tax=Bacillus pseudomycoides TaxID=64104 RepID=A0A2B5RP36_9BACI|nr:ABC transporter ATP-binding protein [Bacillus pseudomycoides]PDY49080.1 sodium ABC transporter ATP-binding protein [Bacillus pseudomycoides]PEA85209.1 sodium ABC transporter ATP-binding protein [Bacillus pseudomycoides]PED72948.1 sodium ABC transporter ATP-binding protein [Bacillus pseudomycoides]PEI45103.1 sodium ABC transporter ATP-binding protein [Bacillus pseudomycoides]PEJ79467.1 sodium ABC transporter ATP-binding protein [Bacillus pseudomycoides]
MLELKNVCKNYKDFSVKNISFTLPRGYIMGFVGPNGAGKSTTIKMIMNLVRRNSGDITIFGKDNKKAEKEIKQNIGFVYDENHYYEELTCEQMKRIIAPLYKKWDEEKYQWYMDRLQVPKNKKIKQLSKGMKMKFAITMALSHHAELIIMDEPTSGLDPVVRSELLDMLQEIVMEEEVAVLFSTHITTDLERIADYITFIHEGEIVFTGEKDAILEKYALVKGSNDLLDPEGKELFIGLRKNKFGFEGLVKDKQAIEDWFGNEVVLEKPTLDDIVVYTAKGRSAYASTRI